MTNRYLLVAGSLAQLVLHDRDLAQALPDFVHHRLKRNMPYEMLRN
jgi:hypothetical protein